MPFERRVSTRHCMEIISARAGTKSHADEEKEDIEIFGGNLPVCHKP